jgi:hypothetical protein
MGATKESLLTKPMKTFIMKMVLQKRMPALHIKRQRSFVLFESKSK